MEENKAKKRKTYEELFGEKKQKPSANNKKNFYMPTFGILKEYTRGDGNTSNFMQALKAAQIHDDPAEFVSSGPRYVQEGIDAFEKKYGGEMDEARQQYRDAAIDEYIKKINDELEHRQTDQLAIKTRGYHALLVREPVKDGKEWVTVNGKAAHVRRQLHGDETAEVAGKKEISMDLVREAFSKNAERGAVTMHKKLENGDDVRIYAGAKAGNSIVTVDKSLKGDETAIVDGGMAISRDIWNTQYEKMKGANVTRWAETLNDGTVVEMRYDILVNGRPAEIDRGLKGGEFGLDRHVPTISREEWKNIYEKMMAHGKGAYAVTKNDGTTITARINAFADGKKASVRDDLPEKTARYMRPELRISPEKWEAIKEGIYESAVKDPHSTYKTTLPDGTQLEGKAAFIVNDKEARPNRPMEKAVMKEENGEYVVSEDIYKSIKSGMEEKASTWAQEQADDGNVVGIRQETETSVITKGKDGKPVIYRGQKARDAVAEMSGMNTDTARDNWGKFYADAEDQIVLSAERSIPGIPGRTVGALSRKAHEERMEAKRTTDSIGSKLMSIAERGVSLGGR